MISDFLILINCIIPNSMLYFTLVIGNRYMNVRSAFAKVLNSFYHILEVAIVNKQVILKNSTKNTVEKLTNKLQQCKRRVGLKKKRFLVISFILEKQSIQIYHMKEIFAYAKML